MKASRVCLILIVARLSCPAQETSSGLSIPATISGAGRATSETGEASSLNGGFRAVIAPSIRLGPHWFFYTALDAHSSSYGPYASGYETQYPVQVQLTQAFVGYVRSYSKVSILIKAGQLSSAFGLFPVEYDDAKTWLIAPPVAYTANLPLRPDQLSCGVKDIVWQAYADDVNFHCGGAATSRYGLTPVTIYGLPGIETQVSVERLDARLQVTNSSPVNPHGLLSNSQHPQWTAGGGYSFPIGLHIGASAFRGPYLESALEAFLPSGTQSRSFAATGVGLDARWSRGPWSVKGEWLRFNFAMPGLVRSPSETAMYAEMKRILSPRVFIAARANALWFAAIKDVAGVSATHSTAPQQLYEFGVGYRLNRLQLLKVNAGWGRYDEWRSGAWYWPSIDHHSFEIQLVTSLMAFSKPFD
jgi:hypothetical protein